MFGEYAMKTIVVTTRMKELGNARTNWKSEQMV